MTAPLLIVAASGLARGVLAGVRLGGTAVGRRVYVGVNASVREYVQIGAGAVLSPTSRPATRGPESQQNMSIICRTTCVELLLRTTLPSKSDAEGRADRMVAQ